MQNIKEEAIFEKEWVHVGNDHIDPDLFKTPKNDDTNKPDTGVLWLSERDKDRCRWFTVMESPYQFYFREKMMKGFKNSKYKCCIVKLSDEANILNINSKEQLDKINKYLKKSDKYKYCLDYSKLSNDYDGIFINYLIDDSFKYFGVDSLIIFNPNIIESYKPASVNCKIFDEEEFTEYRFGIEKEFDYVPMKKEKHIKKLTLERRKNYETR